MSREVNRVTNRPAVLALDQAESSGWAYHDGRIPLRWGLAKNAAARFAVVSYAMAMATERERRLLVVLEDHTTVPARKGWGTASLIGMGDARGRWLKQLELLHHPKAWVMLVAPETWRAKTIGNYGGTEAIKDRARQRASALVQQTVEDHNTAEALVMSEWAALDGVSNFLGKREMMKVRDRARKARTG